jgi:ferredoxin
LTYVVTEPCIRCKYTDCVTVCPVECFHEGPASLAIDPEVCIDCGACVSECPVNAIYPDSDVPPEYAEYLELNARLSAAWPVIGSAKEPPPDAAEWAERKDKRAFLESG